jgi:hypothetical protein
MRIETEFRIGQEVWTEWHNSQPVKVLIKAIKVAKDIGEEYISYIVDYNPEVGLEEELFEEELFSTKEELLKSL